MGTIPEIHDARDSTGTDQSLCNCRVAFGWSQGRTLDPSEGGIHSLRLKPLCISFFIGFSDETSAHC